MKHVRPGRLPKYALLALFVAGVARSFLSSTLAAPNPALQGDLNNSSHVDITDLSILLSRYGTTNADADINGDGQVNITDLSILLTHFGQAVSGDTNGAPAAPTGVSATGGDRQVVLNWNDNVEPDFSYYAVRRSTQSDPNMGTWTRLPGNLQVSSATDADVALANSTTYYYYVTAVDIYGNVSARSAITEANTQGSASTSDCGNPATLWCGDFDTADYSQFTQLLGQPSTRITFPASPRLGGSNSLRVELRPGDLWTDSTSRMQLRKAGPTWGEGADLYFHIDFYIDPTMTIGGNFSNPWRGIFSWPTTEDGACSVGGFGIYNGDSSGSASPSGTPMIGMNGDGGDCGAWDSNYWKLANPVKGGWYSMVYHRKFSFNPSIGFFEFWMKKPGENSYTKQTFNDSSQRMYMNTLGCSGCHNNMRVGLYRNTGFATTDIMYYDNIRATSTFESAQ